MGNREKQSAEIFKFDSLRNQASRIKKKTFVKRYNIVLVSD